MCFWVNEENGGAGGRAYREMMGRAVKNHVAAIEMDGGAEKPVGFGFGGGGEERVGGRPEPVARGFTRGVSESCRDRKTAGEDRWGRQISPGGGGSDIAPLLSDGVPGLGVRTVETHYFDWHHTDADSFDKIVPQEFQANVAALAVMSYVLADMPERIGELK